MKNLFKLIIGDFEGKREWRAMEARAKALPKEYQIVYNEAKQYIWNSSGVTTLNVFRMLLDLFEESATNGQRVLDVTGNDVAAFCDELVKGEKTYPEEWRKKLNASIANKISK